MTAIHPPIAEQRVNEALPVALTILMISSAFAVFEPSPFDLLSLLLLAAAAVAGLRLPRPAMVPLAFAILFLLGNLLAFVEVSDFAKAARYTAISAYMFLIWILFTALFYHDAARLFGTFWRAYLIAGLISAIIGIAAFMHLLPDADLFLKHGRAKGLFKDPNVYGPFLVPVVLYAANRLFSTDGAKRWLYACALTILLTGLLLGFSRAAWGNLVVATLLLMTIRLTVTRSLRLLVGYLVSGGLIVGMLAIGIAALLQLPSVAQMMEKRATLVQPYDVGETGRFGTQKRALLLGLEKPLGTGPGEIRDEFARYPHNVYLLVLVENGWLGLAGFMGFLFSQLALGLRYLKTISRRPVGNAVDDSILIIVAVLLTTALQSLFIDTLHWRHLFMLLGVMTGSLLWAVKRSGTAPGDLGGAGQHPYR